MFWAAEGLLRTFEINKGGPGRVTITNRQFVVNYHSSARVGMASHLFSLHDDGDGGAVRVSPRVGGPAANDLLANFPLIKMTIQ